MISLGPDESKALLPKLRVSFESSRDPTGKLNLDAYIRSVAPTLSRWISGSPLEARSVAIYELVEAFKSLLVVYTNLTGVIGSCLGDRSRPGGVL